MRSMHFWPSLGCHLPTLLVLYFHIPWWGKSSVSFSRVFMIVICSKLALVGLWYQAILAEKLLELYKGDLHPKEGLDTLVYIRKSVPNWGPLAGIQEIGKTNNFVLLQRLPWPRWIEMFSVSPDVTSASIRKSISSFLTVMGLLWRNWNWAPQVPWRPWASSFILSAALCLSRERLPFLFNCFSFLCFSSGQSFFQCLSSLQQVHCSFHNGCLPPFGFLLNFLYFLLNPACWLFAFWPPRDNALGEIALNGEWLLVCTGCPIRS